MAPPREVMPVDVLFVGAGPASLAGAYHLLSLIERHNERVEAGGEGDKLPELEVGILEKGKALGAHAISGAVMDPRSLRELMPDFLAQGFPFESQVVSEELRCLTSTRSLKFLFTPPPVNNHGNYIISISKLVRWLGEKVEEKGGFLIPEFAGRELLYEGERLIGVRSSDKGIDKEGKEKANYQPGADIHARVTVLGEGPRGSLTKMLIEKHGLDEGKNPQAYATGVKETWKLKPGRFPKGKIVHTLAYPLDTKSVGGGFAYGCDGDVLSLGYVTSLDYWHPDTDPHAVLQLYKRHPLIASWLEGAEVISYGAKTIPEGGWYSMPRLYCDGALLVGDAGGFLNPMRLKGIHLGIKSGMLAAEVIFEGLLKDDLSLAQLANYEARVDSSWIKEEMWKVRNFHQAMLSGRHIGMARSGFQMVFGGRDPFGDRLAAQPGHTHMKKLSELAPGKRHLSLPTFDNEKIFDKPTSVYQSGALHEEDQPAHLLVEDREICSTRCAVEYGNPCEHFCPAQVYEMVDGEGGGRELQISASNCVHCKTCDVMDPYQIITWVTPEGGGGPGYKDL